jgi:hypothetical protein
MTKLDDCQQPKCMNVFILVLADFAIAVLCMVFCWKLWTQPAGRPEVNYNVFGFFFAVAFSAVARGLADGEFFHSSVANGLFAIMNGLAAYNLWMVITHLLFGSPRSLKIARWVLRLFFVAFLITVIKYNFDLALARETYLPASIVLFALLTLRVLRFRNRFYFLGWGGLALIFLAVWVRHHHVVIHPNYFDHRMLNLQLLGFGLWGFYLFGSRIARWNM